MINLLFAGLHVNTLGLVTGRLYPKITLPSTWRGPSAWNFSDETSNTTQNIKLVAKSHLK